MVAELKAVVPVCKKSARNSVNAHVVKVELEGALKMLVNGSLTLVSIRNHLVVKVKISALGDIGRNCIEEPEAVVRAVIFFLRWIFVSRIVVRPDYRDCSSA